MNTSHIINVSLTVHLREVYQNQMFFCRVISFRCKAVYTLRGKPGQEDGKNKGEMPQRN